MNPISIDDEFDIIPFDEDNTPYESIDEDFDIVPFEPEQKQNQEELLPLFSREGEGQIELTNFPEQEQQPEFEEMQMRQVPQQGMPQEQIQDPIQQEQQGEFPLEGENDLEREIERNIAQQTARMGEAAIGLPGDVWSFAKSLLGFDPETNLPTSEKLREFTEQASQGYLEPQNEFESRVGELQQDITSMMTPGSNVYSLARNIGIPVVANLVKEGINIAGGDKIGTGAKIGTMIILDLISQRRGGAKKYASKLFEEGDKLVPKGEKAFLPHFETYLKTLEKTMESGGSRPSTSEPLKKIRELLERSKNGEIEVRELMDFRQAINEIKDSMGGYNVEVPPKIKRKIIFNLDQVKGEVIKGLDEYGKLKNPKFRELNKAANESWAAIEQSDKMATFIKKTVKDSIKNPGVKHILGLGGAGYGIVAHGATIAKASAVAAIPLYAGYQTYKVLHQIIKSPTLRRYYGNVLKGAASGNASQVLINAKALDKELEEEDQP
jgi:hypothetical protein